MRKISGEDKIQMIYMIYCRKSINCYSWDAMEACKWTIITIFLQFAQSSGFKATTTQILQSCTHTYFDFSRASLWYVVVSVYVKVISGICDSLPLLKAVPDLDAFGRQMGRKKSSGKLGDLAWLQVRVFHLSIACFVEPAECWPNSVWKALLNSWSFPRQLP